MYNCIFSEDFNATEIMRNDIIRNILFSPNTPLIQNIIDCIPKPLSKENKYWTKDLIEWNSWSVGPLNNAYQFRNNKMNGWGIPDSYQRDTIENHIYQVVKNQASLILEQKIEIDKLKIMLEKLLLSHKTIPETNNVERNDSVLESYYLQC